MREMLMWTCGQGAANSIRLCDEHSMNSQTFGVGTSKKNTFAILGVCLTRQTTFCTYEVFVLVRFSPVCLVCIRIQMWTQLHVLPLGIAGLSREVSLNRFSRTPRIFPKFLRCASAIFLKIN